MRLKRIVYRFLMCVLTLAFLTSDLRVYAQGMMQLPSPGTRLTLSPTYVPSLLKGIKVYRDDPFRFDFILDQGDDKVTDERVKIDSMRLIKYFLASITVPEKDLWVNLSPYEKDRIVPDAFGQTEMGRDLLAQDYILKQITASLMYPEGAVGKRFWAKIYAEAARRYGTTDIPVDTFNKVWIVPEKAVVYETPNAAYVVESRLKVMLESDYKAIAANEAFARRGGSVTRPILSDTPTEGIAPLSPAPAIAWGGNGRGQDIAKQILREIIIPILEQEVNEGQNFAQLRQVYNSLILAIWFKDKIKASIFGQAYVDQDKIAGVNIADKTAKDKIWAQYVESFKKGAYNLIREEKDAVSGEMIPRKYFSGGNDFSQSRKAMKTYNNETYRGRSLSNILDNSSIIQIAINVMTDAVGKTDNTQTPGKIQVPERLTTILPAFMSGDHVVAYKALQIFLRLPIDLESRELLFKLMLDAGPYNEIMAAFMMVHVKLFGIKALLLHGRSHDVPDILMSPFFCKTKNSFYYLMKMRALFKQGGVADDKIDRRIVQSAIALDGFADIPGGGDAHTWFTALRVSIHRSFSRKSLDLVRDVLKFWKNLDSMVMPRIHVPDDLQNDFSRITRDRRNVVYSVILNNTLNGLEHIDGKDPIEQLTLSPEDDVIKVLKDQNPDADPYALNQVEFMIRLYFALTEKFTINLPMAVKAIKNTDIFNVVINRETDDTLAPVRSAYENLNKIIGGMDETEILGRIGVLRQEIRKYLLQYKEDLKNNKNRIRLADLEHHLHVVGRDHVNNVFNKHRTTASALTDMPALIGDLIAMARFIQSEGLGGVDFEELLDELQYGKSTYSQAYDLVRALQFEVLKITQHLRDNIRFIIENSFQYRRDRLDARWYKLLRDDVLQNQRLDVDTLALNTKASIENILIDDTIRNSGLDVFKLALTQIDRELEARWKDRKDEILQQGSFTDEVSSTVNNGFLEFGPGQVMPANVLRSLSRWGKKGLNLLRMSEEGLPVSPGVIISPRLLAQDGMIDSPGFRQKIIKEIKYISAHAVNPGQPLSLYIRSGTAFMLPGLLLTIGDISAGFEDDMVDRVIDAIKKVYASWDSPEATQARQEQHLSERWGTTVILHEAVDQLALGAGSAALLMSPDGKYFLDGEFLYGGKGHQIMSEPSKLAVPISRMESLAGEKKVFEELNPELYGQLLAQALKVKDIFGYNPLVEFVVDRNGKIWLTQSNDDSIEEGLSEFNLEAAPQPLASGKGLSGGAFRGWVADSIAKAGTLQTKYLAMKQADPRSVTGIDGVILVLDHEVPEMLSLIPKGVSILTRKLSVHTVSRTQKAGITVVAEVPDEYMSLNADGQWVLGGQVLTNGDVISIDGHRNPFYPTSGNIYWGSIPIKQEQKNNSDQAQQYHNTPSDNGAVNAPVTWEDSNNSVKQLFEELDRKSPSELFSRTIARNGQSVRFVMNFHAGMRYDVDLKDGHLQMNELQDALPGAGLIRATVFTEGPGGQQDHFAGYMIANVNVDGPGVVSQVFGSWDEYVQSSGLELDFWSDFGRSLPVEVNTLKVPGLDDESLVGRAEAALKIYPDEEGVLKIAALSKQPASMAKSVALRNLLGALLEEKRKNVDKEYINLAMAFARITMASNDFLTLTGFGEFAIIPMSSDVVGRRLASLDKAWHINSIRNNAAQQRSGSALQFYLTEQRNTKEDVGRFEAQLQSGKPIILEIGAGNTKNALALAAANPDAVVVAVDLYASEDPGDQEGVRATAFDARKLPAQASGLGNLFVFRSNSDIIAFLPDDSIQDIVIVRPPPMPISDLYEMLHACGATTKLRAGFRLTAVTFKANQSMLVYLKEYLSFKAQEVGIETLGVDLTKGSDYITPDNLLRTKTFVGQMKDDSSQAGGIDLTRDRMNVKVSSSGQGVQFNFDPAMIQRLKDAGGITPVILDIRPMTMTLTTFLGVE